MNSRRIPVVVLWVHHGSLAIARSLGRLGVPVHGVHTGLEGAAFRSRHWAGRHRWDLSRTATGGTVAFLVGLARDLGGLAILIPTSDDMAELVADHREQLSEFYRFQDNPPALVRAFSSKRALYHLAVQNGIPTPETTFPESLDEVRTMAPGLAYPVMLKASDGLRLQARSGKKMLIVQDPTELVERYEALEDSRDPNLMIQEYIPGGDDTIWMFNGYFNEHSECVMGITGKKLRQFPVHTGATSLGICVDNREVYDLTCRLARTTGYHGILDIGFRYDARDGQYKLLDPNPRVGSSFRLFVTREGHDVVRYLYWDLTDQALPPATSRDGRKWVVEDQDLQSCLEYRREGVLTWVSWARSYRGVEEGAWFAHDDLGPFCSVARDLTGRAFRKLGSKLRSRIKGGA